jgi:hypothetical protein
MIMEFAVRRGCYLATPQRSAGGSRFGQQILEIGRHER